MQFKSGNFRFRLVSGEWVNGAWVGDRSVHGLQSRERVKEGRWDYVGCLERWRKNHCIPFHITCGAWRSGGREEGCPDTTSFLGMTNTSHVTGYCLSIETVKHLWDLLQDHALPPLPWCAYEIEGCRVMSSFTSSHG